MDLLKYSGLQTTTTTTITMTTKTDIIASVIAEQAKWFAYERKHKKYWEERVEKRECEKCGAKEQALLAEVNHDEDAIPEFLLCMSCNKEYEEKKKGDETNVDDRDAPNIYPYKKCGECDERKSCGKYRDDKWVCEECDAGECDECGTGLADEHIFTYEKDGEVGVTVCASCAGDMDDSFREQGYTRDDDEV